MYKKNAFFTRKETAVSEQPLTSGSRTSEEHMYVLSTAGAGGKRQRKANPEQTEKNTKKQTNF